MRIDAQKGASLLEFMVVVPLFITLLVAAADFMRLSYNALTLQFVATRVVRDAVIGPSAAPPGLSQTVWIETGIINFARRLGVDLTPADIRICPERNIYCTADNAGSARQFIVVRISVPTRGFIIGSGGLLGESLFQLSTSVIGKNEPW